MTPSSSHPANALTTPPEPYTRAQRQRLLALSAFETLRSQWETLDVSCTYRCVRGPEVGMAMVRGRTGATGNAFNLGEMTLARASVALTDGTLGHGWVSGRNRCHAELIAVIDACTQHERWRARINGTLLPALEHALAVRRTASAETTAATRVDFFTMVRGE